MKPVSGNNENINYAKKIGELITSGFKGTVDISEDHFLQTLLHYRKIKREQASDTVPPSDDIWSSIEQQIDMSEKANSANVHQLQSKQSIIGIWAAVAAVIIVGFIGIYYLLTPSNPILLADSQSSKIIYTTQDGSKVTLRPYSKLYRLKESGDLMKYKLQGEAFFNVTHNPNRKFVVDAGNGEVTVLGTRFNVSDWGNTVQVYLQRGSVNFQDKKTHTRVILKPGESSTITQKGKLLAPKRQNQDQYLDWLNNVMIFNHQSVNLVFDEIEQHYNIKILREGLTPKFLNETVTGRIHLTNLNETLKGVALVLGGHFNKIGNKSYKFVPVK
ncbi:MAG TPA: FecR domain-containing protein [Balneolales bacterium]|nr:FecR domain-containing protein [Balneolales bacterium]